MTLKAISKLPRIPSAGRESDEGLDHTRRRRGAGALAGQPGGRACGIQATQGRDCFGHLSIEEAPPTGAFTRRDGSARDSGAD